MPEKRGMPLSKGLRLAARIVVAAVFLWAAVLKIVDPLGFARDISGFRLFPAWAAFLIALALPWLEALCAIFLVFGPWRRTSAILIALMLAGFIILTGLTMARGIDTNCGCFGVQSHKADWGLILQDTGLLFLTVAAGIAPSRKAKKSL